MAKTATVFTELAKIAQTLVPSMEPGERAELRILRTGDGGVEVEITHEQPRSEEGE